MAVRIDKALEGSTPVVCVAGRLSGIAVEELMKQCQTDMAEFVLDLSQLRSADEQGVAALRLLIRRGALVRGDSPFIRLLVSGE